MLTNHGTMRCLMISISADCMVTGAAPVDVTCAYSA